MSLIMDDTLLTELGSFISGCLFPELSCFYLHLLHFQQDCLSAEFYSLNPGFITLPGLICPFYWLSSYVLPFLSHLQGNKVSTSSCCLRNLHPHQNSLPTSTTIKESLQPPHVLLPPQLQDTRLWQLCGFLARWSLTHPRCRLAIGIQCLRATAFRYPRNHNTTTRPPRLSHRIPKTS